VEQLARPPGRPMSGATLGWSPGSERAAGVLLHPTSLPGRGGIGDLGAAAERFVDFLAAAGQRLWQFMPLGPVGLGNSPYAAASAFAGNPLLIALEPLVERGWLGPELLERAPSGPPELVDYGAAGAYKNAALRQLGERFASRADSTALDAFIAFRQEQAAWLDDYTLFMALKDAHRGQAWFDWPAELVRRQPAALASARRALAAGIHAHALSQFVFFEQWGALRTRANAQGIALVGDIPIFVAHDSADVWVHQDIFQLDAAGRTTVVAGVPPDYFSATGQLWGNPLYRWDRLASRGYDWWIERFRGALQHCDTVRLDHFRGFEAYWEVPAEDETAEHGHWAPGPGAALFGAVEQALGRIPLIVEDLGLITPKVVELREQLGYPGMRVLQFAFGDDASGTPRGRNPYLPHNYVENCVAYSGTHDNDTTVGWFAALGEPERHAVRRYLGVDGHDIAWDLIRAAQASVARTAIVPLQDLLRLGSEARMNQPGRPDANWGWRYREDQLPGDLADRLAELIGVYGRCARGPDEPPA
jgi:4-alpha-glucanotransferase